jgi:hypothetical protein
VNSEWYIGLDVHQVTIPVAVMDSTGESTHKSRFLALAASRTTAGCSKLKHNCGGIASAVPLSTLRAQLASQLQTLGSDLDSNGGRGQTL